MARLLACLGVGAWMILLWPFPVTTFLGGCVACVTYPLYVKYLKRRIASSWRFSLYALLLALTVAVPIAILISLVTPQAVAGLSTLNHLRDVNWWQDLANQDWFVALMSRIKSVPWLEAQLDQMLNSMSTMAGEAAKTILASSMGLAGGIFQTLFDIVIFVMVATLGVANAKAIRKTALCITGFPHAMLRRFIRTIRGAISAVLAGVILVAAIQGILCGSAFAVAKVPQPAFWGLISAMVAPIPCVGTALVWVPICIWLWLNGSGAAAFCLMLWGVLAVSGIDNFLRPFFLKTGIDAPVSTLILSILCGLAALGAAGIFAGPLLVALGIQAYKESTTL